MKAGAFDALSPEIILGAVEEALGFVPEGNLTPYPSYVNRVYGFSDEEGREFIAKFYRPGRWSEMAILEEHAFLADCAKVELPVVLPLPDDDGETLFTIDVEDEPETGAYPGGFRFSFAVFPKKGGRSFDAERAEDWERLGALAGRLHAVGANRPAHARPLLSSSLALANLAVVEPLVHPEFRAEFGDLCRTAIQVTAESLNALPPIRIHGDLHRGNILERPGEGLLLLDFDDMVTGPQVQDLWLLLPGRAADCGRELSMILGGYGEFAVLPSGSVAVIETLRFHRMLHFLAWRSLQRDDLWFKRDFPDWGSRAFWIQELEDFREQSRVMVEEA
ncbi:MAG: serine/threonine protein kinase [Spirochaetes bacterium]|nr:serine/threonine protein kinase [Spirochaetota bacterium]